MSKHKLLELVDIFNGSTPSTSNPEYFEGDIPWVTPKDLSDQKKKYIERGERNISEKGLASIGNRLLPKGTILFSSRAPIGLMSISTNEVSTNQGFKNIVCKKEVIHNEYLYYLLKTKINQIQDLGTGTTFKEVSKSTLENFEIFIEENLKTQSQIAKVLSDLDAKIELNNKINSELEAMAKLIYDYWFVQFDFPNEKGKPYKSSGGKMVWNEDLKREIPEGWEVKKLKEIAQTGSGGTPLKSKNEYFQNGNIPWINSGEVNESFIIKAVKYITQEGLNNSSAKLFKKGTILMAMYGATAGQVSFMDLEACTNQAICGINPIDDKYRVYLKFGLEDLYSYLISLSSGSARDNLSQDKIKELQFVIPTKEILYEFDLQADAMLRKILVNMKENQELAELRDWLLPMLMNGQVRVG